MLSLEMQVLATLISMGSGADKPVSCLTDKHFSMLATKIAFNAIEEAVISGNGFTHHTIAAYIHKEAYSDKKVKDVFNSRADISSFIHKILEAGAIEPDTLMSSIDILSNEMVHREAGKVGKKLIALANGGDKEKIFDVIREFTHLQLIRQDEPKPLTTIAEGIKKETDDAIEEGIPRDHGLEIRFIHKLATVAKLRYKNVVVIGARPAMGKTTFAINIALDLAMRKHTIYIATLEMSEEEMLIKVICILYKMSFQEYEALPDRDKSKLLDELNKRLVMDNIDIIIDDTSSTIEEIFMNINILRKYKNIELLIIDYLQLLSSKYMGGVTNDNLVISYISRQIKVFSMKNKIPVIELSQLNRGLEIREDKRPMLSDLRSSGSIEQDASVVMFLYRDIIYNPNTSTYKNPKANLLEIIIAKSRYGATGTVDSIFEGSFGIIKDITNSDSLLLKYL